ncbi:DUF6264 family protein [Clavibacter nebraskensis]|uniref:Integral membrane protein n=3 Tax=Clavibacter nebraskensis TaxID=31963 RepID=A0ABY4MQB8_9MICO|nr:DUF6264 family protein [Clavibacter nebraskensis]KXU19999.1 hypothetical protein VV38_10605 [Clavibacter nebraskensis]OAH19507.1 hypothetical protein A3Q38_08130 [Clavibacter nebraskensis]QGV67308.1 hypothetical protein EGX36_10985 [Clavibacter nebraskensis]QGV70104.1 hypothetical protein EGX37_10940 [Clavibacter nebraskensis]QGV72895.1 hypothetical protein EGX35_10940 [Clavibacter nebraskensis]
MSEDDGPRRPGRPAPRYGEYASPSSADGSGSSELSEADARIVAEAAEYRRAQAERDAPASAGRGGKKGGKAAAPQTLAEQMAEERKAARERQQAERREAEKAAADARRTAERAAAMERRDTRRASTAPSAGDAGAAPGTRPERPAYLAGQEPRRAPRRFDAAITVGLLAAGLVNVVGSIGANADPSLAIDQSYALFGGGTYEVTPQTSVIGIAVNVVNIVVFVLAAWISLELVKRRRIAFWVPIVGAIVATVITSVLVLTLIVQDPAFQQIMSSRGP